MAQIDQTIKEFIAYHQNKVDLFNQQEYMDPKLRQGPQKTNSTPRFCLIIPRSLQMNGAVLAHQRKWIARLKLPQ
jgi:hypothetical protein